MSEVTLTLSPAAEKAMKFYEPSMNLLIYRDLRDCIVSQLKGGFKHIDDLDTAAQLLTELNAEIYKATPSLVTPYRIKDGLLWFKTNSGTWHTASGQDVLLSEPDDIKAGGEQPE